VSDIMQALHNKAGSKKTSLTEVTHSCFRTHLSCCSGRRASLLGVPNLRRTSTRDPPQLRRGSVAEGWLRPSQGAEPPGAPPGGFLGSLTSA
jgi:hypothetical protein